MSSRSRREPAGQVLEHQVGPVVVLAPVVDREDVGVGEGGGGLGLGAEALEEGAVAGQGRVEHLDGHPALEGDVVRPGRRARTPRAQGGLDPVAAGEDTPDGVGDTRHGSTTRLPTAGAAAVEGPPPAVTGSAAWRRAGRATGRWLRRRELPGRQQRVEPATRRRSGSPAPRPCAAWRRPGSVPRTTAKVFCDTLPGDLPPAATMASSASSRV